MKLKALGPVKHNGQRFEEGETFDVEDKKQAQALIDSKSAARPGAKAEDDDADSNDPKTVKVVSNTPTPSNVEKATK